MDLTPRELDVLTTIVEDYIATASPVGSRTVSKRSGLRLSPASMRNTMADLTDKGFLEQPHTSAGRVPTAQAFRHYLNSVFRTKPLTDLDKKVITSFLGEAGLEISDILTKASRLLSQLSRQVSLVIAPKQNLSRWRQIDFVLVKPGLVLAILVMDGGQTVNKMIATDSSLVIDDLIKFGNYLNHVFAGRTLGEVRARLLQEIRSAESELDAIRSRALELAHAALSREAETQVYVDGATNILSQPDFSDIAGMRDLLGMIEERTRLLELLDEAIAESDHNVKIVLGAESDVADLRECGVVAVQYGGQDIPAGTVGIIGPLRMDYAKIVPVVDFTAHVLTQLIKKRY